MSLTLGWSKSFIIADKTTRDANPNANHSVLEISAPANATFKVIDIKLYVPVVTLSSQADNKLFQETKTGFERTSIWNKYRSEMTRPTKNNNLNYLIDPTFNKSSRSFLVSFENEEDRTSFPKYYTPKVEIKDFNVLIDSKSFFNVPIKNKKGVHEANIEMSKNNDYTTGNLLDCEYFLNNYKLIAVDLSKHIELENTD